MNLKSLLLLILLNVSLYGRAAAFSITSGASRVNPRSVALYAKAATRRPPSRVTDFDGPTPTFDADSIPIVNPDDIPELRDISDPKELPRPIPHQPWRRGETAGCEAPITAPWRLQAESVIYQAAEFAASRPVVLDVTWFLTTVLVTLDDRAIRDMERDLLKSRGPVINVCEPENPMYYDPADPNPEDIEGPEDPVLFRRQSTEDAEEEARKRKFYYANKDSDDMEENPEEPHHLDDQDPLVDVPLYMEEESRADVALYASSMGQELLETMPQDSVDGTLFVDTAKVSTIAQAILDGLESIEDDCQVLSRHELVLTVPGAANVLESQKQFDAYRNQKVIVETI
jgi:hypothetical protein